MSNGSIVFFSDPDPLNGSDSFGTGLLYSVRSVFQYLKPLNGEPKVSTYKSDNWTLFNGLFLSIFDIIYLYVKFSLISNILT